MKELRTLFQNTVKRMRVEEKESVSKLKSDVSGMLNHLTLRLDGLQSQISANELVNPILVEKRLKVCNEDMKKIVDQQMTVLNGNIINKCNSVIKSKVDKYIKMKVFDSDSKIFEENDFNNFITGLDWINHKKITESTQKIDFTEKNSINDSLNNEEIQLTKEKNEDLGILEKNSKDEKSQNLFSSKDSNVSLEFLSKESKKSCFKSSQNQSPIKKELNGSRNSKFDPLYRCNIQSTITQGKNEINIGREGGSGLNLQNSMVLSNSK